MRLLVSSMLPGRLLKGGGTCISLGMAYANLRPRAIVASFRRHDQNVVRKFAPTFQQRRPAGGAVCRRITQCIYS